MPGSSTKGGHSVDSVSPQEDIHRSSEKNNELLHWLIESVMCSERVSAPVARKSSFELDDPFQCGISYCD